MTHQQSPPQERRNIIFPTNMGEISIAIQNALNGNIPKSDCTVVINSRATE